MSIDATVTMVESKFLAILADGREIAKPSLSELAIALARCGVPAGCIRFRWSAGHRMITAGQQVALQADIARLIRQQAELAHAA
jgi:hypothetical protein